MLYFEYPFIKDLMSEYRQSKLKLEYSFDEIIEKCIDNCILMSQKEAEKEYESKDFSMLTYSVIIENSNELKKYYFSVNNFWNDWDDFVKENFQIK